jgi:hypothetical protein
LATVGDRSVLYIGTFVVPLRDQLQLDIPAGDGSFRVAVSFDEHEQADRSPVTWKTVDGVFHLAFHGLREAQGLRILQDPVRVGSIGNEPLSLMTSVQRHHKAVQIHLQFMSGGTCL